MRNLISKKISKLLARNQVLLAEVLAIHLVIDLESNILRIAPINILSLFLGG
jgi:hypothetical protein